jgi:hypothetical protein
MTRAIRRVPKQDLDRKHSTDSAVSEFDADVPTIEIPRETMAALVYGAAVRS